MAKFVLFTEIEGEPVAVNTLMVTYVRASDIAPGTFIAFGKDRGRNVRETLDEVVQKLNQA